MACICGQLVVSLCARCQRSGYCSKVCQLADWKQHRVICRTPHALDEVFTTVITEIYGNIQQFAKHNGAYVRAYISETLSDFLQNNFHFVHLSRGADANNDVSNIEITIQLNDYTVVKNIKKEDVLEIPNPGSEWTVYVDKLF